MPIIDLGFLSVKSGDWTDPTTWGQEVGSGVFPGWNGATISAGIDTGHVVTFDGPVGLVVAYLMIRGDLVFPAGHNPIGIYGYGATDLNFPNGATLQNIDLMSVDRITLPAQIDVRLNVAYGYGYSSTGMLSLPSPSAVLDGVTYGALGEFVGTYVDPSENDVRDGVVFGDPAYPLTGNMVLPSEGDVRDGKEYGSYH